MAASISQEAPRHYDTIVLGAGMAGLACASKLFQDVRYQKPNSLLVLEGRDRIGGRIGTVNVNGCRLDTGANWIHGIGTDERPNPLTKILPHAKYRPLDGMVVFKAPKGDSTATVDHDADIVEGGWVDLGRDGKPEDRTAGYHEDYPVIPAEYAGQMFGSIWAMIDDLHEVAEKAAPEEAKNTTVLRAMHSTGVVGRVVSQLPSEYHEAFCAMVTFVEGMEAAPLTAQSAESEEDNPGMGLLEYALDDFKGDQVFLHDGYMPLVHEIATPLLQAGMIQQETIVNEVSWSSGPAISIQTSQGSFTANRVICTLPLGVLKRSHSTLFSPALPSEKVSAINSLGFGTLDKIFLVYSSAWWEAEPYLSLLQPGIVHDPSEPSSSDPTPITLDTILGFTSFLPGLSVLPDGKTAPGLRSMFITNLHSLTGHPVLCAFVSCANAESIEALSNDAAGDFMTRCLTDWFRQHGGSGGVGIPAPEAVHVTRWKADKFSRGSYSHMITGLSETADRKAFADPVRNAAGGELRFAGEHTSMNHFATAHGALLSGWREAEMVLSEN